MWPLSAQRRGQHVHFPLESFFFFGIVSDNHSTRLFKNNGAGKHFSGKARSHPEGRREFSGSGYSYFAKTGYRSNNGYRSSFFFSSCLASLQTCLLLVIFRTILINRLSQNDMNTCACTAALNARISCFSLFYIAGDWRSMNFENNHWLQPLLC